MSAHQARAVRRENGTRFLWHAVCSDGCTLPQATSRDDAERLATLHMIRAAAAELRCQCFHGDEFDPAGLCPRCRIMDALGSAA